MPGDQIRCPKCWACPCSSASWGCDACGNSFNTFETKGQCSACGKKFEHTQCLNCEQWSPHSEWYQCIRCPKCNIHPCSEDMWFCECGHSWNTFDTRGRCPGCNRQWEDTQCLSCCETSPHLDWYEGH